MSKVDTKIIFPSNFIGKFNDPILESMLSHHAADIPRIATRPIQNKKVGIIYIDDNIKELDFSNTLVDIRASKCDALVLMFGNNLAYPGKNYDDTESVLLSTVYNNINEYFALPPMIHLLIMGVEQTLLRRIILIGQEIKPGPETKGGNKWILVPKIRIKEIPAVENS